MQTSNTLGIFTEYQSCQNTTSLCNQGPQVWDPMPEIVLPQLRSVEVTIAELPSPKWGGDLKRMLKYILKPIEKCILFHWSLDLSIFRAKLQNPLSYQALSEKREWLVRETVVASDAYLLCIRKISCMFLHNLN